MGNHDFDVRSLPEICGLDQDRINLAKKRQVAVWKREKPDKWPVIAVGKLSQEQEKIPNPNLKEAFYDSDLMLCSQMRGACAAANSNSDIVPSIRANMGTGTIVSCLGLEQEIFEDKMPWLGQHLTKEQVSKLTPDDIKIRGTFELGLRHMRRFKEIMGDIVGVYCMDTQGPFDLAHLVMGDEIFYQFYDDPPFVHHLMDICLDLGIKTHTWMKEVSGEPKDKEYHGGLYAENMGIRICEDTTAIVGEEIIREFAMPYTQRLAKHFGGAWVHYCGRNDHLTQAICEIPEVRAINFGIMPCGKQSHNWKEEMDRMAKYKKVFFGAWPKDDNESDRDFLRRMHESAVKGLIVPEIGYALFDCIKARDNRGGDPIGSLDEALDFWYSL